MSDEQLLTTDIDNTATTDADQKGITDAGQGAAPSGDKSMPNDFLSALPEDLRGNEAFKDVKDVGDLAKRFAEASGKVPVVPENADAYKIEFPDGYHGNEELLKDFRKTAHESGLSQKQVDALVKWNIASVENQKKAATEFFNKAKTDAEGKLKQEWGDKYDPNLKLARKVIRAFGDDSTVKFLNESGLASDPNLIRFCLKIGSAVSEDVLVRGDKSGEPDVYRTDGGQPIFQSYRKMKT